MSINPWEFEKNLPPPPPNYVPGMGRGAMGFVTGGDLGSIATPGGLKRPLDDNDNTDYSDHKFDNWSGFDDSKLYSQQVDKEDIEAEEKSKITGRGEETQYSYSIHRFEEGVGNSVG
jgi:hypothetical protein